MKRLVLMFFLYSGLVMAVVGCATPANNDKPDPDPEPDPIVDVIDYSILNNIDGFAELSTTSRTNIDDMYVATVADEMAFLLALIQPDIRVIEITADLDLGYNYMLETYGAIDLNSVRSVYRRHSATPLLHPTLIQQGVGLVEIKHRQNLMIYSKNGSKILHTKIELEGCSDIVIRNLEFDELWEWDEYNQGGYKRNDWDYFTLQDVDGVWFDHLIFNQAYDGIIDMKEHSQHVTISWTKLYFFPNDYVREQINYLEAHQATNPYYQSLRDDGLSVEEITRMASYQKKGFNIGNSTDGKGFEDIMVTFHHMEIFNLQDRMPRLRKGDIHLYEIILDNTDLHEIRAIASSHGHSMVNQGIVTTEQGAVLMEHSLFIMVDTPIKNHQDSDPSLSYSGKYKVVNSELRTPSRIYFGSSGTPGSLWVNTEPYEALEFSFRNYDVIPYLYDLPDIYYLPETFQTYPTGTVIMDDFDWLAFS